MTGKRSASPIRVLGRRLSRALARDAAYRILDGCGERFTFLAGGCWMLAEAVRRCLPRGRARLWAVVSPRGIEHVAVRVRSLEGIFFLDGDGAFTDVELLGKMATQEGVRSAWLAPFQRKQVGDILYHRATALQLADYLAPKLGDLLA